MRLSLTSICGTDYGLAAGHLGPTRPILGHEGVGTISALGTNVPALDSSIAVGQRVGVAWTRDTCGACAYCTSLEHDGETRCAGKFHSGVKVDGTFAEYAIVPARYLCRIPAAFDDLPDEAIAPVLCGGVTAYKALKGCGAVPGRWIAVSGAGGGVGAFAVAYGRAMGYRVVGVDAGAEKGAYAIDQGAEAYVDVTAEGVDVGAEVKRITGGNGAEAVIVAAGVGAAYQAAFGMLAPFGTLMCVGIPPPDQTASFHPLLFIGNGYRVVGSSVGTRRDIIEALEFVKRGLVSPVTVPAELGDMDDLILRVAQGKVSSYAQRVF